MKLYDLAFVIKKNETFNHFYIRFLIIITSLNYIESQKIYIL